MPSNLNLRSRLFSILVLLMFSYPFFAKGQLSAPSFVSKGAISNDPGIYLLVQNTKNPCGNQVGLGRKKTIFRLRFAGYKNKISNNKKFLVGLVLKIEDCKGKIISKRYTITLANKEGEIRNDGVWFFEGSRIVSFDASVQEINEPAIVSEAKQAPACENRLPETIYSSADNEINPGESVTLSVDAEGKLCQNAFWEWIQNDCEQGNQIRLDRNPSIVVFPRQTTTYFVRIREKNKTSPCVSVTVYVAEPQEKPIEKPKPKRVPVVVYGAPGEEICPNAGIRLSVSGGLDAENRWVWRKNTCDGELIGMGNNLDYKTDQSTLIFVQDANDRESECKEIRIPVKKMDPPVDPILNNGEVSVSICQGESTLLQLTNSSELSRFRLIWTDMQNKVLAQSSSSVKVSPASTSKYFIRGEGECNTITKTTAIEVIVINRSTVPGSVTETKVKGKTYNFSVNGGVLESGANWKWYNGKDCTIGEAIGEGAEITTKIKKLKALSVRAEGGKCGNSECFTHTVVNNKKKSGFVFLNVGVFEKELNNLGFTIGMKRVYLRYKTGIKNISAPYDIASNSFNQFTIPSFPIQTSTYYEFNGQRATIRSGYTGGFMIGGRVLRIYLGGGIGEASSLWGVDIKNYSNSSTNTTTWGAVLSEKYNGIEAEAGLFLRLGFLNIMGGVNLINDNTNGQYIDGTVGLGLTF